MKYPVAEKFKAPQGEGSFCGTPMAFIRLVGCSVGQGVCVACDTEYEKMREDLGGGLFTPAELSAWAAPYERVCITGGEPLDRDLRPLIDEMTAAGIVCHVETSGTKHPDWLDANSQPRRQGVHAVTHEVGHGRVRTDWVELWIAVSPKPGWLDEMVTRVADEVKVINGGLGPGPGWPTVDDADQWAQAGMLVYLQPRNDVKQVDREALREVLAAVDARPALRVSVQLHKFLETR